VVVDHIPIIPVRVGAGIEPPDLIEALVGARNNLIGLGVINVFVDVFSDGRWQCLNLTRVDIELIRAHPIRDVVGSCCCPWANNGDVVSKLLQRKNIRRACKLKRIERRICPY
jgi:hypothetical protein